MTNHKKVRTTRERQRNQAKLSAIKFFGRTFSVRDAIILVQNNQGRFLGRLSNRLSLWQLTLSNTEVVAVYDKDRQIITRFMKPRGVV